jgi:hypothetical protein
MDAALCLDPDIFRRARIGHPEAVRHFGSLLLAAIFGPAVFLLTGTGLSAFASARTDTFIDDPFGTLAALGALLLAGVLYGILIMVRLSPVGPGLAGMALMGASGFALVAPQSYDKALGMLDVHMGGAVGQWGLGILLGVPLVATLTSPRRWRREAYPATATAYPGYPPGYPAPAYQAQPQRPSIPDETRQMPKQPEYMTLPDIAAPSLRYPDVPPGAPPPPPPSTARPAATTPPAAPGAPPPPSLSASRPTATPGAQPPPPLSTAKPSAAPAPPPSSGAPPPPPLSAATPSATPAPPPTPGAPPPPSLSTSRPTATPGAPPPPSLSAATPSAMPTPGAPPPSSLSSSRPSATPGAPPPSSLPTATPSSPVSAAAPAGSAPRLSDAAIPADVPPLPRRVPPQSAGEDQTVKISAEHDDRTKPLS